MIKNFWLIRLSMFLYARVKTSVCFANIGWTTAKTWELIHDGVLVRFWDRIFRRYKSANINSLPVDDELDSLIYESGDLTRAASHDTTTFFPMKGNLIQIAGMFSVSLVLLGSLGFAVKVLINLFTDQRGKPFFWRWLEHIVETLRIKMFTIFGVSIVLFSILPRPFTIISKMADAHSGGFQNSPPWSS